MGCMAIRDLFGFMFAVAAGYRNAGSTPDLFQTSSKSKERARIVGYKSYKWKGAAAKRQKGLHLVAP
jgi:hypothetical protein